MGKRERHQAQYYLSLPARAMRKVRNLLLMIADASLRKLPPVCAARHASGNNSSSMCGAALSLCTIVAPLPAFGVSAYVFLPRLIGKLSL